MKIYKLEKGIAVESDISGSFYYFDRSDWDDFINRDNLYDWLKNEIQAMQKTDSQWFEKQKILPPIQSQEIWAAGVTYLRSKVARMEESKESGGDTFYDKVYDAERPEIFFKGTAVRAVGTEGGVKIRKDSTWDVPEPELTLFVTSSNKIVGYTIGNDMSSRSIEGENPLYLPQAKVYDKCAGLGPCLYVPKAPIPLDSVIRMEIHRGGKKVFEGDTQISQMKRSHSELVEFLTRECSFPQGVFLMTGTCIVPDYPFTLQGGDEIFISIDHIGTLKNIVEF
ncbi:MAG: fumarylacetoacetate hydrolase family protein [Saprospiraceae bacterium]|nr:fumarylacetoacetate hydrolase family protein [Saprospiraceae bacterium]